MRSLLLLAAGTLLFVGCGSETTDEVARSLEELTRIRDQKRSELTEYFEDVGETVSSTCASRRQRAATTTGRSPRSSGISSSGISTITRYSMTFTSSSPTATCSIRF